MRQPTEIALELLRRHLPDELYPSDAEPAPLSEDSASWLVGDRLCTPYDLKVDVYEKLPDGRERLRTYCFGRLKSEVILGPRSRELRSEHPEWN